MRRGGHVLKASAAVTTAIVLCGGVATAATVRASGQDRFAGVVTSVNGVTSPGTCGTKETAGEFALASSNGSYTVNVATATSYKERGVSSPSFADVCVGDSVQTVGSISTDIITASEVSVSPPHPEKLSGLVESVNGTSTADTCGVSGNKGDFALASSSTAFTVDVNTSTTFTEHGVSAPSFANVCVGDRVHAVGPASASDVVTASEVTILPARLPRLSGSVSSVDGTSTAGACGTSGNEGGFGLVSSSTAYTVDVDTSTTFKEHGVSAPSFADVCVGDPVQATGSLSTNDVMTAADVTIVPPRPDKVSGTVASVDGMTATGTCGVKDTAGEFTLTSQSSTDTVDVDASTTFKEHGVRTPSYVDVCVGSRVQAVGTVSTGGAVAAEHVTVTPPRTEKVSGTVASVDGSTTSGTCGPSRAAGEFTLSAPSTNYTVNVGTATAFKERGASSPSFSVVCVGDRGQAVGNVSPDGVVTAGRVIVNLPSNTSTTRATAGT